MKFFNTQKQLMVAGLSLLLTACGSWMGSGESKVPLEGERISIIQFEQSLTVDPDLAEKEITLPKMWQNRIWPQTGGYPSHRMDHLSLGAGELKEIWRADIGRSADRTDFPILSAPIIAEDRIFILNNDSQLLALDMENGRRLWRVSIRPRNEDQHVVGGGLAYAEGKIFATAGFNILYAVDAQNGGMFWRYDAPSPLKKAPTVWDGRVFASSNINETFALDTQTGRLLWRHAGLNEGRGLIGGASPAADRNMVVVPYSSGEVFALRSESGAEIWSLSLIPRIRQASELTGLVDIQAHPVIDGNRVYVANFNNLMVAVDNQSGALAWENPIGTINMPWVAGDMVYVLSRSNQLIAMDKESGNVFWTKDLPSYENQERKRGLIVWKGPVMAGGRLILAGSHRDVLEIDPRNGEILSQWRARGAVQTMPIVAGDTLYLLTQDGSLTAYRGAPTTKREDE